MHSVNMASSNMDADAISTMITNRNSLHKSRQGGSSLNLSSIIVKRDLKKKGAITSIKEEDEDHRNAEIRSPENQFEIEYLVMSRDLKGNFSSSEIRPIKFPEELEIVLNQDNIRSILEKSSDSEPAVKRPVVSFFFTIFSAS